jgi:uncharacterized protein YcbK (DUF882 family)
MRVSRRAVLRMGGGAFVSAMGSGLTAPALATPALIGQRKLDARTLSFDCINLGERLKPIDYWVEGKYVPHALAAIDKALRDFVSDEVHPIDPKLLDVLHHLGRTLDTDCSFELISGYRSPKTNELLRKHDPGVAENSLHMKGTAVDVALKGRPLRQQYETALAMHMGGVGFYPDSDFIHIDIGRIRHWQG